MPKAKNESEPINPPERYDDLAFRKGFKPSEYIQEGIAKTALLIGGILMGQPKEMIKELRNYENFFGLIEGSIIGTRIAFPNKSLRYVQEYRAHAGEWVAYDYNRPAAFPTVAKREGVTLFNTGEMWTMHPPGIQENDANTRTTFAMRRPLSWEEIRTLNRPSMQKLVEQGFVTFTSQEEAFARLGLKKVIPLLRSRNIQDEPVYQVTPKGNTVIHLFQGVGEAQPKEQKDTVTELSKFPGIIATS